MKILNVPKTIGKGEGGGDLPKLYEIYRQIDEKLYEIETRIEKLESGGA